MGRIRVRRLPEATHELLLNLTNRHVHAQLVNRKAGEVVLAVHSNEPEVRGLIFGAEAHAKSYCAGTVRAAGIVGSLFGDRARAKGVEHVSWRRPARYHGKVKAFIDEVRGAGVRTLTPPPRHMPTYDATDN